MGIEIKNKVALVTGANRGIGKAIVESFLNHGAKKVYLAVRNVKSTTNLEEKYGDRVETVKGDVSSTESINKVAEVVKDVDIVVNNAGIGIISSSLGENAEKELMEHLNVNTFGLLRIAKAFEKALINSKGALVQLNSVASIKNFPPLSTYSASKAASYSLTQGLRAEFLEKGVQVLSVHPGPIDTDMAAGAGFTEVFSPSIVSEGIIEALAKDNFHLFPDDFSKQFEAEYQNFSENIILK